MEHMSVQPADRLFYAFPQHQHLDEKFNGSSQTQKNVEKLLTTIRNSVIGSKKAFSGPFGLREVAYLDYIASGRALSFLEDYIRNEVLPEYGNTHTTTTVTSLQTTLYRHEARDIIRNAVNASEHDSVIFVSSGSTGAIHKLIHALNLKTPPVVFVGPYEHHSNLLPWLEAGAQVIRIKETKNGLVDCNHLENQLKKWQVQGRQLIGSFSAASNITGILVDVNKITICLHKHGALAFWDYASAAPYVRIDVNPVVPGSDQEYVYKDAVFCSPHKFVGGTSTPGVLVAKKNLFRNSVPDSGGGGSVFYVRRESHRYLQEPELREEGGTPAIVESVRAGLVFQLKEAVTPEVIMHREEQFCRQAVESLSSCENLVILGNTDVPRLPIFSFLVYHPLTGRFLHYNFVTAILNDVFGIQARGGCACAGPYAMDLLGLNEQTAEKIESLLVEDSRLDRTHLRRYREYSHKEILRPGFTRLNLPYFLDHECVEFVIEAVRMVAQHGWKLLPQYIFNPETGEWRQKNFQVFKDRKWLGHISYSSGEMQYKVPPPVVKGPLPTGYQDCLKKAEVIFEQAKKARVQLADQTLLFDEHSRPFRWFTLPSEALDCLRGNSRPPLVPTDLPFLPPKLKSKLGLISDEDDQTEMFEENCEIEIEQSSKHVPDFSEGMVNCLDKGFINGAVDDVVESTEKLSISLTKENETETSGTSESTSSVCDLQSSPYCSSVVPLETNSNVKNSLNSASVASPDCTQSSIPTADTTSIGKTFGPTTERTIGSEETFIHKVYSEVQIGIEAPKTVDDSKSAINQHSDEENMDSFAKIGRKAKPLELVCKMPAKSSQTPNGQMDETNLQKCKWFSPPKSIFKPTVKAIEELSMIQDGDRVLVCLSGGKDSLSLLHTVRQFQFYSRGNGVHFEFGAVTVDPQTPAYDPSPLKQYLKVLGVPYFYESQCILETAENLPDGCASICSFCSRMKRGRIYAAARREGYNVLALGQHLDDLAESFMMSFFHNGVIRTMKAHYTVKEGDLRVIRPFVYVREKDLRTFAEKSKLPVIAENCPACFEAPKERHRTKQLLASQELLFPHLYNSIMAAMKPVMAINKTGQSFAKTLSGREEEDEDIDAV